MQFFNYKVTRRDLIKMLFSYCTYCRYVNPGFKNQNGVFGATVSNVFKFCSLRAQNLALLNWLIIFPSTCGINIPFKKFSHILPPMCPGSSRKVLVYQTKLLLGPPPPPITPFLIFFWICACVRTDINKFHPGFCRYDIPTGYLSD